MVVLSLPAAAIHSASATFSNTASSVDNGSPSSCASPSCDPHAPFMTDLPNHNTYRMYSSVGEITVSTASSASYVTRDGLMGIDFYPGRILNLSISTSSVNGDVSLQWTAPGNDGYENSTAGAYIIKYSSVAGQSPASSAANFAAATSLAPPAPLVEGTLQTATYRGLLAQGVTYYFAIEAVERDGMRGVLSNGATILTPVQACAFILNVDRNNGPYTSITAAVDALPNPLLGYTCIIIQDGSIYPEQVNVSGYDNNGSSLTIEANPASGLTPSVEPPGGTAGFVIAVSSVNIFGINVVPTSAQTYGVYASSAYVQISSVNVIDPAGKITNAGIALSNWSSVSYTTVTVAGPNAMGLWLQGSATSTVSYSAIQSNSSTAPALYLNGTSAGAFTGVSADNPSGIAVLLDSNANGNTFSGSAMTSGAAGAPALSLVGASGNVFGQSGVFNPAGPGVVLDAASAGNAISLSTVSSRGIALSVRGAGTTVSQSYIQGSTAAFIVASTGTVISGSALVASASGDALYLGGGSVGLTLSTTTLAGGALGGSGVHLDAGNSGQIVLSTNQISGAQYGLFIATQAADAQIFASSNTILPTISGSFNTYGVYADGLMSGATVQDNAVYYQTPGSNAGWTAYAFYIQSSSGVFIDHNRINEPDMVRNGSYKALAFNGTINSTVTYNDVFSSGSFRLANFYMVQALNGSLSLIVRNNIFESSVAVTGSSQTVWVDPSSQAGFTANYNDYFSSNTLGFQWGVAGSTSLAGWQASGQDAGSISGNPLWWSMSAGAEDFHLESSAGRWNPSLQAFVNDAANSPTIDAADPNDLFANEVQPNGSRANQGSYGNTAEASRSALPPTNVKLAGVWLSSAAVSYGLVGAPSYEVDASTSPSFRGVVISVLSPGATVQSVQGLLSNTTYYLRAGALWGPIYVYSPTVISTSTWSQLAAGTTAYQLSLSSVAVNWIPLPASPPAASSISAEGYLAQASTAADFSGTVFSSQTAGVSLSTLTLSGLIEGSTYFFRVGTLNWDGVPNFAASISFIHFIRVPQQPFGIAIATTAAGVELAWLPVERYADRTSFMVPTHPTIDELNGYIVSRATLPVTAPWADVAYLSSGTLNFTDTTGGASYYYSVRAGNISGLSERSVIRSAGSMDAYLVAPDGLSYFDIPAADVAQVEGATANVPQSLTATANMNSAYVIEVSNRAQDLGTLAGRVVQSVEFDPYQGGFVLSPAFMMSGQGTLRLHYAISGSGNVASASLRPGTVVNPTPTNMSVYWYNGRTWVQLYGTLDTTTQSMIIRTQFFGQYQLRTVERTGGFAFSQSGISNRFLSPNGDHKNDNVVFYFDNPQDSAVTGKIFDLRGRLVASSLPAGPISSATGQESLIWDGMDGGRSVPGGVYIYQIQCEGQTFTGTVVVIK